MSEERRAKLASKFSDYLVNIIDDWLIENVPNVDTANAVLKGLCGKEPTLAQRLPSPTPATLELFNVLHDILVGMLPTAGLPSCDDIWASGD